MIKPLDLDKNKKYLLACSFGPDSMALFHMLKVQGYNFMVAHVNYNVRPEAKYETDTLNAICAQNDIEIEIYSCKFSIFSGNFESKARDIRYNFFKEIYYKNNIDALLVAHQQDDVIETYFLQQKRGGYFDNFGIVKDESEAYNQHPQPYFPSEGTELMPTNEITLDDLVGDFDAFSLGVTDSACPICYGTGFVGGFSLYNGYRHVITADEFSLPAVAELHYDETPWRVTTYSARVKTIIPKNIVGIDVFRCLNGTKLANYKVYLDGKEVSYNAIIKAADGKEHEITLLGNQSDSFTHFEIQFNMSVESTYFEVPKLSKGTDLNKLDDMQDFQILMSPLIPRVDRLDIVTESMWGKALMIQSTSLLNTKERQMLGWECDARVIQPEELYNLLPRRQRVATIGKHVNPVLGNYGRRP